MARINKSRVNFKGINELIDALDKKVSVRVGILGDKGREPVSDDLDMAGLGAVHEFGTTINREAGWINTYKSVDKDGDFKYGGKFRAKDAKSTNFKEEFFHFGYKIVIPTRSFLRMPLLSAEGKKAIIRDVIKKLHQDSYLEEFLTSKPSKNEINNTYREYIKEKIPKDILKDIADTLGQAAQERVQEAFTQQGFGNWAPNAKSTIRQKGSSMPLVNDGHLRGAISYEVKEL